MAIVQEWPADEPLNPDFIDELNILLESGEVIVYPTNTLYGMGASIFSDAGINRIHELKMRPDNMPYIVMATPIQIREICEVPDIAETFFERNDLLVTAILPARETAPSSIVHKGTLAVRLPCSELTKSLVEKVGPITSTSANIHGDTPPITAIASLGQFGDNIPIYIDSGALPGTPSTLIDFTNKKPKVIRKGALSPEDVRIIYG